MKGHRLEALVFSLIILACFLLLSVAYNLSPVFVPDSPLYFLKSVREILELKFAPTTYVRSVRVMEFTHRRIGEVKSLSGSKKEDLIVPALERYWSHWQELLGITDLRSQNQLAEIKRLQEIHMGALFELYNEVTDEKARRSIRTTIFRLFLWEEEFIKKLESVQNLSAKKNIEDLRNKSCAFLIKEASSGALNEVERSVTAERAEKCFKVSGFDNK